MALETINGSLQLTRLSNESADYVARREELRLAEIELMRQRERVAAIRRRLPAGAIVQDYVFQEGPSHLDAGDAPINTVRLSELFSGPDRSLIIYHLMYGKRQTAPCPMCTMWIDGYNGVSGISPKTSTSPSLPLRIRRRCASTLVVEGGAAFGCSVAGTARSNTTFAARMPEGRQDSTISVFTRDRDGTLHHSYSAHPWMAEDVKERGIDLLTPVYNALDLTPQGRGDWYAKLTYPDGPQWSPR